MTSPVRKEFGKRDASRQPSHVRCISTLRLCVFDRAYVISTNTLFMASDTNATFARDTELTAMEAASRVSLGA